MTKNILAELLSSQLQNRFFSGHEPVLFSSAMCYLLKSGRNKVLIVVKPFFLENQLLLFMLILPFCRQITTSHYLGSGCSNNNVRSHNLLPIE